MRIRIGKGHKIIDTILYVGFLAMLLLLARSVFISGYSFTFFGDELAHSQFTYLIANGYQPYRDFFMYASSLFNMALVPFFNLAGYSFEGVYRIKIVMIGIFIARLAFGFLLLQRIRDWRAGMLFVFLTLLDPFSVATGMQIRPDNLMYPVYLLGLWCTFRAMESMQKRDWLLSGMTLSLANLVLIKLAPAYAATVLLLVIFLLIKKRISLSGIFFLGTALPPALYVLYFAIAGALPEMIRAVTADAASMTGALWYPTRYGFFYQPNNTMLYGIPGMPAAWYVANIMPLAGAVSVLILMLIPSSMKLRVFRSIIGVSMLAQWLFLRSIDSAFAQYYQSLTVFFAVALAMLIGEILNTLHRYRLLYTAALLCIGLFIGILATSGIRGNLARATMRGEPAFGEYERIWDIVPENEPVFHGFLFRPLSSGIPYGLFAPEVPGSIRAHYPDPVRVLEDMRIRFLFMSDYELNHTDPPLADYIRQNFRRHPELDNLMLRKEISR